MVFATIGIEWREESLHLLLLLGRFSLDNEVRTLLKVEMVLDGSTGVPTAGFEVVPSAMVNVADFTLFWLALFSTVNLWNRPRKEKSLRIHVIIAITCFIEKYVNTYGYDRIILYILRALVLRKDRCIISSQSLKF